MKYESKRKEKERLKFGSKPARLELGLPPPRVRALVSGAQTASCCLGCVLLIPCQDEGAEALAHTPSVSRVYNTYIGPDPQARKHNPLRLPTRII